jgi:hypothetical protein
MAEARTAGAAAAHIVERAGQKPQGRSGAYTYLVQDAGEGDDLRAGLRPLIAVPVGVTTTRARTAADRNMPSNLQTAFPCRK